ncbi:cardiac-enriched FHL2-interacting protein [Phodopus roborovskii]|uniref:RGD1564899 protein n=1 Tax=Phodopus roborovskii TaxID=109678 RepID=A0AAV0A263_PHORO|nr:cardiac-enriched FHL2-interacting protein [Phodopus roborovskii]CAH7126473.1 RGD1564899 [Phodopus roborovskii]
MQGNKKCTDGFSDTSSIGSVMDDADREVSNLTDRAFRSLCISEDTSFHDSDLALSPDITSQGFGTFHQETVSHTNRKSGIWSQLPSQGTEHSGWAATFQQQPKYVQGEEKYPKNSPPTTPAQRRLEVPISGLRSSGKPISKVSSLIRSFDRTENRPCDSRPPPSKPPALKNPKFAPPPEGGVNFCFDSAFLTVRRVPAEASSTHQSSHQPGRVSGEQESPSNPEVACHSSDSLLRTPDHVTDSFEPQFPSPPLKPATAEPGRGEEWVPRGTFLHSESSAFESWTSHQPKLLERKDIAQTTPESKALKHYEDMPLLKESHPSESKVSSPCQGQVNCAQEETRSAFRLQSTSGAWGSRESGSQAFPVEGNASQIDPQMKRSQPPWRKPKMGKGRTNGPCDALEDKIQHNRRGLPLYSKLSPQGQLPENGVLDLPEDPNDHYSPPFNISKLLTPIIPTKHVLESSDTQPVEISPSPPGQLNGYQEKEPNEAQSRDSYKSKAPSLLFNLKDVRKHVKSTYSPLPLLKSIDEKTRGKQEPVSNGVTLPNGLEENPPAKLLKEMPADAPSFLHSSTQKDPDTNSSESFADSHTTLGSPSASSKTHFSINGEAAEMSSNEKEDANGGSKQGPSQCGWHPDARERLPRKHLSLKLHNRESETGQGTEKMKPHQPEKGLSRSTSQETEPEQEMGLQNLPLNQKFSPGPLSPEEEDVFYSDSQSDFTPCLQTKAKFSTSSSDQSFASFDDQQKIWFTEGPREDRKSRVSAGDDQKDEKETMMEKDEPQQCALSNGRTDMEGQRQEETQIKAQGWSGGTPQKASGEEVNFRGSWVGADKDTTLPRAKDSTPLPASTNKHRLFPIKDNTLRATPVIKPIILPLLRTVSSEDSLSGGHKENELPRQKWGEDAGSLYVPESQEICNTPLPSNVLGTQQTSVGCEDKGEVPAHTMAQAETSQQAGKGSFSSLPPVEEEGKIKPPLDIASKAPARGRGGSADSGKQAAPQHIPTIALPPDDLEDPPPSLPLHTCWEEQGFQSHFLSAPRTGPSGRSLVPSEAATSPNPSSLGESSTCSPVASSVWEEASQAAGEQWLHQEPPGPRPWASQGRPRLTRREDMTHSLTWEAEGSDPQLERLADLRALSPRVTLLADTEEKAEVPAQLERAVAGKPPAVPPKTEKALRRAKKLASKRRKSDQAPEKHTETWEVKSFTEDTQGTERRPMSPEKGPRPRFPAVRSLPPPMHRHSVSCSWEPEGRWSWGLQPPTPQPPYPATQKVLQDPQSGQYFVFDVPLQVKIKTFYDPETGKYVKVSVPTSEEASSEPPLQDALAAPYLLYPGFRPVPVTSLMPLRCSSQLAAPTFLRQGSGHRPQSSQGARLQPPSERLGESTQHTSPQRLHGPPHSPEEEGEEAPSLSIISTDDLEDFATEGVS